MKTHRITRPWLATALSALTVLSLAGCGASAATETNNLDTGAGLAADASMSDYQAAFEDVEPITLKLQLTGPDGSLNNKAFVAYADAIEEWSDGKLTFERGFSNAYVPAATEWAAGLNDGRIDMSLFLPFYNPDIFPQLSDLTSATFLDGNAPTSTLVSAGWINEAIYTMPAYQEEAEANGVHILALGPSVSIAGIFCAKELTALEEFSGVPISASGTGRVTVLSELGFSPQSIAFTELYEALERGVVECGSTTTTALTAIGAVELVPHMTADPVVALTGFPPFVAISQERWSTLPLVAQQLLFDRLDVYLSLEAPGQGQDVANWLDSAIAAGGGIHALDAEARAAVLAANQELLGELESRGTDTSTITTLFETWESRINDELYPEVTEDLEDFLLKDGYTTLDYTKFVDAVYEDALLPQRPE